MGEVFCWHHGDIKRLECLLKVGVIDAPEGFCSKHRIIPGTSIQIAVRVKSWEWRILYAATVNGTPRPRPPSIMTACPFNPKWPLILDVKDVIASSGAKCPVAARNPRRGSHW